MGIFSRLPSWNKLRAYFSNGLKPSHRAIHSLSVPRNDPARQFAEKQEAERRAKEEEEAERLRLEAEAAEEALRKKPVSKIEQVKSLLIGKLAERLELCNELLVLLRREKEKARRVCACVCYFRPECLRGDVTHELYSSSRRMFSFQ